MTNVKVAEPYGDIRERVMPTLERLFAVWCVRTIDRTSSNEILFSVLISQVQWHRCYEENVREQRSVYRSRYENWLFYPSRALTGMKSVSNQRKREDKYRKPENLTESAKSHYVCFSSIDAELCRRLDHEAPNFEPPDASIRTFRRLLLAKCEYEFENRILLGQSTMTHTVEEEMDPHEARVQARKKAIGNIKLIGELGKLDLVSEAILHKCLKTLLKRGTNENLAERCEDLECLTKIMQTVGKKLDQGQGKNLMDQYLDRIKKIQAQKDLPIRIKFILQDIIDLRSKHWVPRFALIEKETKLTDEDGNQQTQITYKYQPNHSNIPSLANPFAYSFHAPSSSTPPSLFQRPAFHPSILQRPRPTQGTSDRYQFERLNPLSTGKRRSYRREGQLCPSTRFRTVCETDRSLILKITRRRILLHHVKRIVQRIQPIHRNLVFVNKTVWPIHSIIQRKNRMGLTIS